LKTTPHKRDEKVDWKKDKRPVAQLDAKCDRTGQYENQVDEEGQVDEQFAPKRELRQKRNVPSLQTCQRAIINAQQRFHVEGEKKTKECEQVVRQQAYNGRVVFAQVR